MRKAALLFLFVLSGVSARAEPTIKLRMDVSPREITIGDPIRCNVTVIFSSALKPVPLTIPTTGEFELLAALPPEIKTLPDGNLQTTHPVLLTTFSTGTLALPPFVLNFRTENGQSVEAKTQSLDIHVISLLEKHGDEGRLRPLKGTFNFRSYFWLWIGLIVLALAVALYFGIRAVKQKRRGQTAAASPSQPPEETAWEALHKLEDSDLLEKGHVKEFYIRLSVILRTYLEERYTFSSLDRTTSELLAEIRRLDLPTDATMALRVFIENSDLVKFAKLTPSESEVEDDLTRVKQFITLTTPQKIREAEKIPV